MGITLILLGVGCVVAAMVGGGVKAGYLDIPRFASIGRQWMLGMFGLALMLVGFAAERLPQTPDEPGANAAMNEPPLTGDWKDQYGNRYEFDQTRGKVELTLAGVGNRFFGTGGMVGSVFRFQFEGRMSCEVSASDNPDVFTGTCQYWGQAPFPVNLERQ